MASKKSIIDAIVDEVLAGNNNDAEKLFVKEVFNVERFNHSVQYHEPFQDYLAKYSYMHFGDNEGYIASFDTYSPFPQETRSFLQALEDSFNYIKTKNYNNARRDLLAIGQYLSSKNGLYQEYVAAYFSLILLLISDKRQKGLTTNESDNACYQFINSLIKKDSKKFHDLGLIAFRDFKSLVLRKLKNEDDGLSVFDLEFSTKAKVKELNKVDIDNAIEEFNKQLAQLVGIENVKQEITTLINLAKINLIKKQKGIKVPNVTKHLVFTGNPGTGKTTVARLLAEIYHKLGLLSKGQFIETERSQLVGEYVGHTAPKTKKVIESAKGGILFIDEAYSLATERKNDFGNEVIETLLKLMEDYRDDLIVVVAGYPEKMKSFLASNPGLNSRFATKIQFNDYTTPQLIEIFELFAMEYDYQIEKAALKKLTKKLDGIKIQENFGNAREVRNIFDQAIKNQANRLSNKNQIEDKELSILTALDIM
jgi:SpoVK/Ycf46/Vps4 family AAA+-type ATPase